MVKQQIYDPITKKTKLLDPLGRKAREIYKGVVNKRFCTRNSITTITHLYQWEIKKSKNHK